MGLTGPTLCHTIMCTIMPSSQTLWIDFNNTLKICDSHIYLESLGAASGFAFEKIESIFVSL